MSDTPFNFGGLPPELTDRAKAKFLVLPVPFEESVSYGGGTGKGPDAVIEASRQVELWDEELLRETCDAGIHTLPAFKPARAKGEKYLKLLAEEATALAAEGKVLVSLGGEHSITPALVEGVKKKYPKLSVLQIDAHADLRDEYEGKKWSHACAMKRVIEQGCKLAQAGIRNFSKSEVPFVDRGLVATAPAHLTRTSGDLRKAIERFLEHLTDDVYITVDIDGLDPSLVPGTGTPEPGGLSWYDTLDFLRPIFAQKNVVAFDIVEVAPLEGSSVSQFVAAKLAYRMMGYRAARG
ncbi:MAG: agmatinase [Planctomycetes bacterium]|nr:agmatinase [Planctomycetota bacterium]